MVVPWLAFCFLPISGYWRSLNLEPPTDVAKKILQNGCSPLVKELEKEHFIKTKKHF